MNIAGIIIKMDQPTSLLGFVIFIGTFVLIAALVSFAQRQERKRLAGMSVVKHGVEYPNNFHVLGVGYYHAASRVWYPYAWNEYREDRGYYWNRTWNLVPDQRMVLKSVPLPGEVDRVNEVWRQAGPSRITSFWNTVEREGFGTAIRRSEGS